MHAHTHTHTPIIKNPHNILYGIGENSLLLGEGNRNYKTVAVELPPYRRGRNASWTQEYS